nr:MAG TPA: hypothetical protein [Caudoviricetes sp.]
MSHFSNIIRIIFSFLLYFLLNFNTISFIISFVSFINNPSLS